MYREALSNIERGRVNPSKQHIDLLLNRLGVSARQFAPYPLSKDDFEAYVLRGELNRYLSRHDHENAATLLLKMSNLKEFDEGIMRQTYLHGMAVLCLYRHEDTQGARAYLDEAIKITLPKFDEKLVNTYLLGDDDMEVIGLMANVHEKEGNRSKAMILLEKLVEGIRKCAIDPHEKARSLAFVAFQLILYLGREGRRIEALDLCNEAINEGEAHRAYEHLPMLKYLKAYNLFQLGMHDEIESLVYQAYYGSLALGNKFYANEIKERAEKNFGIVLK